MNRVTIGVAAIFLFGFASPTSSAAAGGAARASTDGRQHSVGFGTLWSQPAGPVANTMISIEPEVTALENGGTKITYKLPDGELIESVTPPPGFDPLSADAATLAALAFPPRPSDPGELQDWTAAMAAYESDDPSTGPLQVDVSDPASGPKFATYYTNWAGYIAGTLFSQSQTYVAVKGNFTVPSNTGTCSSSNQVGFWIGLGGTESTRSNDLVQQGVECGNTSVGSGSAYRPFTEFANTASPVAFCGYSSWTLSPGDVIYQNMSFQTSQNKAFFYLEDQTSGVTHSCSATPPTGWSWDLNTAEWIAEAPTGTAINFNSVHFYNTQTELSSNSTWVTLASQPVTKTIEGSSGSYYCISPGSIGIDGASFTDTWHQSSCF